MSIPDHIMRYPTKEAIDSLAKQLGLPNTPGMQDWEYEVADPSRIYEFLKLYKEGNISNDEKFVLMETLIESFEESNEDLDKSELWKELLKQLEKNISNHIYSVWYWSFEDLTLNESWRVTPYMRELLYKHKKKYA